LYCEEARKHIDHILFLWYAGQVYEFMHRQFIHVG
jgi:hypothetical protein